MLIERDSGDFLIIIKKIRPKRISKKVEYNLTNTVTTAAREGGIIVDKKAIIVRS